MAKIEALNIFMVPVLSVMAHTSVLKYSTTSKMMPMMARICFPFSYEQPPYVFMIRERAGFVKKGLGKWQTFCYNKHTCIKACKFVSDKGGIKMAILQDWQKIAYNENASQGELQKFWQRYFLLEKGVYEKLLTNPDEKVEGTVKELADKYGLTILEMAGFLDGINDSLVKDNPIETMDENTRVNLVFDKEKLYKNMVDAKADWLYNLPMWDDIFDKETKHRLYMEQKKSGTVIVGKKVGRNDPCPCGSGKKYKFCCGKNK